MYLRMMKWSMLMLSADATSQSSTCVGKTISECG
jgi:hypothetical protein